MDITDKECFRLLSCGCCKYTLRDDSNDFLTEPLGIIEKDGDYYFSCLPELEAFVRGLGDKPFSQENLEKMHLASEKAAAQKGMTLNKKTDIINRYDIKEPRAFSGRSQLLTGSEDNICFSDLEYMVSKGPVFGISEEEGVVSLSGAVVSGSIAEIYIETAPAYRKKGYASDCLLNLCNYLLKRGFYVVYECRSENEASNRLVKKAGGVLKLRYVRFIGRK